MGKKGKRQITPLEKLGFSDLVNLATDGPDISCVVTAATYIENALGGLLLSVLLDGQTTDELLNSPLSGLSSAYGRSSLCYCLGLIDKVTYTNAKQIAVIRNKFAHSPVPLDFGNDTIKKECTALQTPALFKEGRPASSQETDEFFTQTRIGFVAVSFVTFSAIWAAEKTVTRNSALPSHSACYLDRNGRILVPRVIA